MSLTLTRQAKVIIVSEAKNPIDNESLTMCKLVDAAKSSSCGRYWRLVSRDIHFMQVHTCKASGIGITTLDYQARMDMQRFGIHL